jgi:hypothetical protein
MKRVILDAGPLVAWHTDAAVCTTDKDFLVYRRLGHERIPLIAPFGG